MKKELKGVFDEQEKEPVIERIFKLIDRYPSRSAAARAWGVNINTIKNYYRRQDIQPIPRPALLKKIAEHEGVSLEWLKTGEGDGPQLPHVAHTKKTPLSPNTPPVSGAGSDGLYGLLSLLTEEERQTLYLAMVRKGVDTMLELIDQLALLSPSELERAIRLVQQIREGASEGDLENELTHPTHKQAG
ncbi:hypothetical protein EXW94_24070 [Enterobacter sp. JMULE2]|uniref:hypothetical protein n=1 Tax=Enterobacter sp. JMULE2 TaxID=2518340 RepID=UPI0015764E6A|nr:hypothetical protein [Enterobacter sp. JMULE2]NTZ40695.1 hypothetical protein [Enterobacter sp. JMULE2]